MNQEEIEEREWAMQELFRLHAIQRILHKDTLEETVYYIRDGEVLWGRIAATLDKEAERINRDTE